MRRALVTGGNRGIGRAIASGLREAGLEVVIGSRDLRAGQEAAEAIGGEAVEIDLSSRASIEKACEALGEVDVLVNNAGVMFRRPMLENPDDFETTLAVMLHGPYHMIRLLAPGMKEREYGRIVNLSSGWGSFSENLDGPGAYGTAKAALNALTLALSRELPGSIKLNAMCPGWVHTDMGGAEAPRTPEEGADTAIWLSTLPDDGPTGGFFRDRKAIKW